MPRYRTVHAHNAPGGYCEFTAADDAAARAEALRMAKHYGAVRSLGEITTRAAADTVRPIAIHAGDGDDR